MPENVHIPLGKVQAAYDLTDEELYNLIQKLWERKQLFYKELWAETYEKFWLAFTGQLAENCLHFLFSLKMLNVTFSFSFGSGKGQDCQQCAGCDQEDAAGPVQECHGPV